MPSTNKTPFLGLSNFEGTDKLISADYNRDMDKLDDFAEQTNTALDSLNENTKYEIGTTVLTNSKAYPFNNSDATVSLITPRDNLNYIVTTEMAATSGCVGEVEVYDKQLNGFKLRFTGSGTQATVKYYVQGGLIR